MVLGLRKVGIFGIFAPNYLKLKTENIMKRVLAFLVLVAFAMGEIWAGNVSQQMAQRIGRQFLSTTVLGTQRAEIQLQLVSEASTRGEVDYYVFNVDGGGFVIVAGDNRVKPILAYSTTGSFDPQDVSEGFEFTLNTFRTEIQYIREHNLAATYDIVMEWNSVNETGMINPGRQTRAVVGPFCQTIWNQNFPYNSQCPEDEEGNGGHVYAGCVATAMGQAMKFYDWPPQGVGTYSYNPSGYAQQTANFGETEYHFELMPPALDSTSTEDDYFYIAQFLHHCGISVDMQYSGNGSGAYSDDVPIALRNYFRYNCDDHITNYGGGWWPGYGYNNEEWAQMLKDGGLDEHIPLYYSGSDDNGAGGHAFICDGYDENDYFHFNWGWSGRDDAWCPIGALNTTKYAFNTFNGFTGHIIPNSPEYLDRPEAIDDFAIVEGVDMQSVTLNWTNPSNALNGNPLETVTVYVYRNNEIIFSSDGEKGEHMSFTDTNVPAGLYKYSVVAQNEAGYSRKCYLDILVGEKCLLTFVLQDEGGDGWKGAAISVTNEDGQRIAVIGMDEGSIDTLVVPLLQGNLNFIWNHGWYHSSEEYDTDDECSFFIFDGDNNLIYTSEELEDGIFLNYINNCEFGTMNCYPVQNLQGEYQWHNGEEYGAYITWNKPVVTPYLHHFQVYLSSGASKDGELIAEIEYDGSDKYAYFDNAYIACGVSKEETYYSVRSVYTNGWEQCESDFVDVMITITDVEDHMDEAVKVYPNPSNGTVIAEGNGRLTVMNTLGQVVKDLELDGQTTMELPRGVFFVRINGTTKKVVVE